MNVYALVQGTGLLAHFDYAKDRDHFVDLVFSGSILPTKVEARVGGTGEFRTCWVRPSEVSLLEIR